jgi:hypothetical protein
MGILLVIITLGLGACSEVRLAPVKDAPKTVSLKIESYCQSQGYELEEVFATNLSTQLSGEGIISDFDRDGLADEMEMELEEDYNLGPGSADTNGDGFTDLVTYSLGLNRSTQSVLRVCADTTSDADNDGITDCEEDALGLNPDLPDTDGDGVPDGLELRYSMNPKVADSTLDVDNDGQNSLAEVKNNTPINDTNNGYLNSLAIQYQMYAATTAGCAELSIKNIPVVPVKNGNLVVVYFLERTTVAAQGDVNQLRFVKVLFSKDLSGTEIVVSEINNQLIGPLRGLAGGHDD